ncbi:MAG: SemiSWEET transporter [Methylococcaceae bacterium]|jgi:MtN3 and saliva related transmembrane protein|nr:SemiSWEET transporter [Methylococcaceae bacterium]MDZ4157552.1 SemiSWEET transporter [Methylococcales bacterium]MDP2394914.1 SemiSWEET transporter [Methylococcaceae bacterium]MDP3019339.1 SemiSWEET transporter [Methylococcaceae bacterium]MDP3389066.1 SemiSWEET transporter [Methylococcaceae bacterium]
MSELDILGLVASCFTSSSFAPQIWRTWKTRDVSSMSLSTYLILTIGVSLWLLYGVLKGDLPLIVANTTMVMMTGTITLMIVFFNKR